MVWWNVGVYFEFLGEYASFVPSYLAALEGTSEAAHHAGEDTKGLTLVDGFPILPVDVALVMAGPGVRSEGPRRRFGHGRPWSVERGAATSLWSWRGGFTTVTTMAEQFYAKTYTKRGLDAMVYVACVEGGADDILAWESRLIGPRS